MFNLSDPSQWKRSFGIYPIFVKANTPNQYALLSGGIGDFCLDITPNMDKNEYDSYAWSLNTKNYIAIEEDSVKIYNWLKDTVEIITKKKVENNIETFYKYIQSTSYTTANDAVPFIINLFRKMRNLTHEEQAPLEALNLLYILLLSLSFDIESIDYETYGIICSPQLPDGFELFIEEIRNGVREVKPDLDIILRHCSGSIFQEAHRIVNTFYADRDLFGNISSKLITSLIDYSSTYYTPQYVSRTIVEQCLRNLDINCPNLVIFDPACGSGEFLVEILKQLHNKNYLGKITIRGWDKSECGISTTSFLLKYAKRDFWNDRLTIDLKVVEDSLCEKWDNDVDILLMNPPYKAWELLSKEERELSVTSLPLSVSKPNLAIPFFYKAMQSLKNDGVLGCVLPTTFFTSDNYSQVRNELKEIYTNKLVGKLGNFVFESALTDVSIYVGKRKRDMENTTLVWCSNEKGYAPQALCALRKMQTTHLAEIDAKGYSIYYPENYPDKFSSWKVISKSDYNLKMRLERLQTQGWLVPLNSIFTVKQGIRTGDNKVFIISQKEYDSLCKEEQKYYRPSVDNDAIIGGQIQVKNYVWFPYNDNGLTILTEQQLQDLAPFSYQKFIRVKKELIGRKSISNKDRWWVLSRHRDWLLKSEPRIVSTEFGSAKSFALDLEGIFVVERGYAWIPKKKFPQDEYYFYLAFFSSSTFEKMLSIYSKQLAGGSIYDLAPKYNKSIPILSTDLIKDRNIIGFTNLVQLGQAICSDGSWYYQTKIDDIVGKLLAIDYDR